MICKTVAIRVQRWFVKLSTMSYSTLNRLKWMRNKKVMRFGKNKRDPNRKKKCVLQFKKTHSFYCSFFDWPFGFALQRWFVKLLRRYSNKILNHSNWGRIEKNLLEEFEKTNHANKPFLFFLFFLVRNFAKMQKKWKGI